jgi:hypothetical protein
VCQKGRTAAPEGEAVGVPDMLAAKPLREHLSRLRRAAHASHMPFAGLAELGTCTFRSYFGRATQLRCNVLAVGVVASFLISTVQQAGSLF